MLELQSWKLSNLRPSLLCEVRPSPSLTLLERIGQLMGIWWGVALILGGDFYTGSVLASTLTKLVLRYGELEGTEAHKANALRAEVSFPFSLPYQNLEI